MLRRYSDQLAWWMEAHERLSLWTTLAIFAAFAVYRALITPLWFDELFTLFIARLHAWPEFLRAMPVDNQPPLGDLLTHIALRLFGERELAVRLPELAAYVLAGLLTYKIARRRGTAIQALFAMALLLGASVNKIQAITARPYELMLLMTAIVFACWQSAASRAQHRVWPLCGLALGLAGAVLTHHFAIIQAGVLLAAGEAARLWVRRRVDWGVLLAVVAGLTPLVWTVRIMRDSRALLGEPILHSKIFWARPGIASLKSYQTMAALPLLCIAMVLAALLIWAAKVVPEEGLAGAEANFDEAGDSARLKSCPVTKQECVAPHESVAAHEWAAAIALALLVPIQILITALTTNYYLPRYAVGASLGLALLCAWSLPRMGRLRAVCQPMLALSTACFVVSVAVTLLMGAVRRPAWKADLSLKVEPPYLRDMPGGLPLVVANGLDYAQEWWYATPGMQARMVYLYDVAYAETKRDPLPELSLSEGQFYIPMNVQPYAPFLADHPHFLLLAEGDKRLVWLPQRLADEGWQLTPIARSGADVLYEVGRP